MTIEASSANIRDGFITVKRLKGSRSTTHRLFDSERDALTRLAAEKATGERLFPISPDRSGRDLSIGLFFGALFGIVGVLATIDWDFVWKPEHRTYFICSAVILLFVASGSLVGIAICCIRLYRTSKKSSYSRLKGRIESFFRANQ